MICPTCKQPVHDVRLGVRMTPTKVRLFDLVRMAGEEGCTAERINEKIWDGKSTPTNVKSHVYQINEMIEETEYKIIPTKPRYGYRLIKYKAEKGKANVK